MDELELKADVCDKIDEFMESSSLADIRKLHAYVGDEIIDKINIETTFEEILQMIKQSIERAESERETD